MIYSTDLRERVIAAVDKGIHIDEVAETFSICSRIIYNWLNLREKTNSLEPKTGYQKGHSHKITDWEQFITFVQNNSQCTALQMTVKWKELTNLTISESSILRALHKMNFTCKKKRLISLKRTK